MIPQLIPVLAGGAFSLDAYMASQSDGFWFDLTRSDTMFQEDVGPTPADGANEVIGLALSQRLWGGQTLAQVVSGATELVPAGNWNPLSGGILSNQSQGGFRLQSDASDDIAMAQKEYSGFVVGRTYKVSVSWSGSNCDTNIIRVSNAAITAPGSIINASISASAASREYYFTATATTLYFGVAVIRAAFSADITVSGFTIKEITRYAGIQSTTGFKPKFQTGGAEGDGVDDRLATLYTCGSGDNWLILPNATVPATLSGAQIMVGAQDGSANGFYLGITTAGELRAKVGQTVLDTSGLDLRGAAHDLGMWIVDSTIYLFADGEVVASGAWTGSRPATTWSLFSVNANGTSSAHFAGKLSDVLAGRDAMSLSRAIQIVNAA